MHLFIFFVTSKLMKHISGVVFFQFSTFLSQVGSPSTVWETLTPLSCSAIGTKSPSSLETYFEVKDHFNQHLLQHWRTGSFAFTQREQGQSLPAAGQEGEVVVHLKDERLIWEATDCKHKWRRLVYMCSHICPKNRT